jgi:hypothetical protein
MNLQKILFCIIGTVVLTTVSVNKVSAQQYKLRQSSSMMGMKTESTIYVKGMRKRTEAGSMMGMPAPPVTIEQCDLQRTIKLNDKKKLYFIEPFAKDNEEVIDEDAPKTKTVPVKPTVKPAASPQKGGVIDMWYSITDTGERKQMYGFTARHVWTSQKMKPSPDACYMKDSMVIKTDGWYIDLPQFNCPVHFSSYRPQRPGEVTKPDCTDRYITHRRGKGKLGFPLIQTTTIIMGNASPQMSEINTTIETLELSTVKLDSMLFEIPPGYSEAKSEDELQEKMNVKDMMKEYTKDMNANTSPGIFTNEEKKPGIIRIGVFVPTGDDQVQAGLLQKRMAGTLNNGKVEGIAVTNDEEARKFHCDYTLASEFTKIKSASKVGGLLKAIKNADVTGSPSFNISANLTLKLLADGSVKSQPSVSGKYDGKVDEAAGAALDDGCRDVLKAIK